MIKLYFTTHLLLFQLVGKFLYAQEVVSPMCTTVEYEQIPPLIDCSDPWDLIPEASDEFNGSVVDLSKWDYFPGWGHSYNLGKANDCFYQTGEEGANGDLAYYTNGNNVEVSNGTFKIYIKQEEITAHVSDYCPDGCQCPGGNYDSCVLSDGLINLRTWQFTSGSLFSKNKYSAGKYEIRLGLSQD